MSDPVTPDPLQKLFAKKASAAPKGARRGRPKKRHDIPAGVPIDGDYKLLALKNENPAFVYKWFSVEDRGTAPYRSFIPELWGPGCCQPAMFFGDKKDGSEVRFRELVLHKAPRKTVAAADLAERRGHNEMMQGLLKRAVDSGGRADIHTTEVTA